MMGTGETFQKERVDEKNDEEPKKKKRKQTKEKYTVEEELKNPASVWNKKDKKGQTPLYRALWEGDSDIVASIVQQPNIDYDVKTNDGVTLAQAAFWGAVNGGDVKCLEILAAQETFNCWNVPDNTGYSPIMYAVSNGKTEIAEILLRCPRVELAVVNLRDVEKLEVRKVAMKKLLWTVPALQERMICADSLADRQAGRVSSLVSLAGNAMLLSLAANNNQERLAGALIDRLLEGLALWDRQWKDWVWGKNLLLEIASCSGGSNNCLSELRLHHQYFRSAGGGWR